MDNTSSQQTFGPTLTILSLQLDTTHAHAQVVGAALFFLGHASAQAYKPGVTDYNYTQIARAAALSRSTLNYTDAAGANLTVRLSVTIHQLGLDGCSTFCTLK
jgi:hypothetical protein